MQLAELARRRLLLELGELKKQHAEEEAKVALASSKEQEEKVHAALDLGATPLCCWKSELLAHHVQR